MASSERGAALILALIVLSFLAVVGGALLSSTTLDLWIGRNYLTRTESLFLAEAGLAEAREKLRTEGVPAVSSLPFVQSETPLGTYRVWLRSDISDTLRLVSTAEVGNSRRTLDMTVRKGAFPQVPPVSSPALERLAASIAANAMDVLSSPAAITNYGSPSVYRVGVVDGDCSLGSGTGYGLLLVRGKLTFTGGFAWNGLILVIGEGVVLRRAGAAGAVTGGLIIARTVDSGPVFADLNQIHVQFDRGTWAGANASLPYEVISIREY